MNKITAIIVDDEQLNIQTLQTDLNEHSHQLQVLATFTEPAKALVAIKELKPDVIFLDIEMPVMDGITLARQATGYYYEVVFVTGFDKYMHDAIRVHAFDFLKKPIKELEIKNVVESLAAKASNGWNSKSQERIESLKKTNDNKSLIPDALYCQLIRQPNWDLVKWDEIVLFEMDSNSELRIYTKKGQHYTRYTTLVQMEKFIQEQRQEIVRSFLKISRVHIINHHFIKSFNPISNSIQLLDFINISNLKPLKVNDNIKKMFREMFIPGR